MKNRMLRYLVPKDGNLVKFDWIGDVLKNSVRNSLKLFFYVTWKKRIKRNGDP